MVLKPNLPGILMIPTEPANPAAATGEIPKSTKNGTKCKLTPLVTNILKPVAMVNSQKLDVLKASLTV